MCKFANDKAPGYKRLLGQIRWMIGGVTEKVSRARGHGKTLELDELWATDVTPMADRIFLSLRNYIDIVADVATAPSYRSAQAQPHSDTEGYRSKSKHDTIELDAETRSSKSAIPCYCMSTEENPKFFVREKPLAAIRHTLSQPQEKSQHRILSLWGAGGTGKTQLALAYAYERKRDGVPIILWVNSESELNILQGLSDAAIALKLEGVSRDGQHQRNKHLLKAFLETSGGLLVTSLAAPEVSNGFIEHEWLLVFDNADDYRIVKDFLVPCSNGSVLITSRKENITVEMPIVSEEVGPFEGSEGSEFLMTILNQENMQDQDIKSVQELCYEMGGLPLALTVVGKHILIKKMPVAGYHRLWRDSPTRSYERLGGLILDQYPYSLSKAWTMSFKSLKDGEGHASLFSILCFLGPDDIPSETFLGLDRTGRKDVPSLLYCTDPYRLVVHFCRWLRLIRSSFENIVEDLLNLALIKRNSTNRQISVHRVIQLAYRESLPRNQRASVFDDASRIMFAAFPKFVNGLSMRDDWEECQKYAKHVTVLARRFDEYQLEAQNLSHARDFCLCLAACAW